MRFLLLIITLFSTFAYGQLSNKHWLPPLHSRGLTSFDQYVFLSTPEPIPFQVTVTNGNGVEIAGSPFTISQNNPVSFLVSNSQPSLMLVDQSGLNLPSGNNGLILEGSNEFYTTFKIGSGNHGEIIVSKGRDGIGNDFRLGSLPQLAEDNASRRNFVSSFMATEDATTVTLSEYDPGVTFTTSTGTTNATSQTFNLDEGESVVITGYTDVIQNLTGFIGARLVSNNPIAVSTGNIIGGTLLEGFNDVNLDQIVPIEEIGTEYVFIRGNGSNNAEFPLIIATEANTQIFINGSTTPYTFLMNPGDYIAIPPTFYQGTANQNMHILTDKPVYSYQVLAGSVEDRSTGLNFIPPLSCSFPNVVDLIPSIDKLDTSTTSYGTDLFILTTADADLTINGTLITTTPESVIGNTNWVTYRVSGYTNDVKAESTGPMSIGIFGFSGTVGYAGHYSGFGENPTSDPVTLCSTDTANLFDAIISDNIPTGGSWTPALDSGTDVFNANEDSSGTYTYTVSQTCGDISVDVTVNILPPPSVTSITNNGNVCESEDVTFTITATPNSIIEYTINNGATLTLNIDDTGTNTITLTNSPAGDITLLLTGISDLICTEVLPITDSNTATVDSLASPNLTFSYTTPICESETITLPTLASEFTTGGNFSSTTGLIIDASTGEIDITNSPLGTHSITYTFEGNTDDCISDGSSQFNILIETSNTTSFNFSDDLCLNSLDNDLPSLSAEGYTGTWSPSTINTSSTGTSTYTFTPDLQFCANSTSIEVNIINCSIPQGISPNDDNKNDFFDLSSFSIKKLQIYNRYGTEVYTKLNYENEWYGQTNNGDKLPTGTYYYVIDFFDLKSKTGWVYINK